MTNGKNVIFSAKPRQGFLQQFCVQEVSTFLDVDYKHLQGVFRFKFDGNFLKNGILFGKLEYSSLVHYTMNKKKITSQEFGWSKAIVVKSLKITNTQMDTQQTRVRFKKTGNFFQKSIKFITSSKKYSLLYINFENFRINTFYVYFNFL